MPTEHSENEQPASQATSVPESDRTPLQIQIAEERIQQAAIEGSAELSLSDLGLTSVPESLAQLSELKSLDLSDNRLSSLPEFLGQLAQLQSLNVRSNQLTVLPDWLGQLAQLQGLDASANQLTELPASLGQLAQLRVFDVGSNQLTGLPASLGQLAQLEFLDAGSNQLTVLPASLGQLTQLQYLDVSSNQLTEPPTSLGQLTQLQYLYMSWNQLTALPANLGQLVQLEFLYVNENELAALPDSLGQLGQLEYLDVSHNQLRILPMSLRALTSLRRIWLRGNERLNFPPEMLADDQPSPSATTLLDYYFRVLRGRRWLNEAKLILVGRGGVGKTCLIKRLVSETFNDREPETPGIEIQPWPVTLPDGDSVRLHVWDFGGQEILHATHQFFLTERTLYLLVLSGREGTATQDAEYWLQFIKSFGGQSKVLIALNKTKQHPFDVNRGLLLEKYPFIVGFVATDCLDATGIADLRRLILDSVEHMEHRKAAFPSDWFEIKERLAGMAESYVSWDRYQEICSGLGESDIAAQRQLASFLHILGIALNYRDDPRLRDTHVLNPRWVTEGIYTLLRGGQRADRSGVLSRQELSAILDVKRYPPECHEFLLRLMEKFQLCFELLPGHPGQYLMPELLGENQPDLKPLLETPGLDFRFQYEILPEGLLPRFIVQTHRHSEGNPRWRSGVVLSRDGCSAIVRADVRERRVDVHITGNGAQRRELLAIIRDKFDEQHRGFKGLVVDERMPVPGEPGITISYKFLLDLEKDGEEWHRPEGASKRVRVVDLLNGVESAQARAQTREFRHSPPIFISYCHKDKRHLDDLRAHLEPLLRNGLSAFSDTQIAPGSRWMDEIEAALRVSKIAVLLVTKDFLNSDFIHQHELGPVLREAAQGGMRILWVPVGACSYAETPLKDYQPVRDPEKPLAALRTPAVRDAAWVEVCKRIRDAAMMFSRG